MTTLYKSSEKVKKKISLFMPALSAGGSARVMLTLAEELANRGYQVDIVVTRAKGDFLDQVPDLVRLVDLESKKISLSIAKLIRYIRNDRPEFIISALTPANIVAIVSRVLSFRRFKIIISQHSTLSGTDHYKGKLKDRLYRLLAFLLYRFSDGVVAVSQGVAEDLIESRSCSADKVHVIYNPIITNRLRLKSQQKVYHPWLDNEVPVILGVGRLIASKDFFTLIDAFYLVRKNRAAKLLLLGEGPCRGQIEDKIASLGLQEDVQLLGYVENPYSYMRRADLLVSSSQLEGFCNVLVESLVCGTGVVSTNCPNGPSEILMNGLYGGLVPVGDSVAMAESIIAELCCYRCIDPDLDRFEATKIVDQYEQFVVGNVT